MCMDVDVGGSSLDEDDEIYAEAVETGVVGFIPIVGGMFVVEGWSHTLDQGTDVWSHFEVVKREEELKMVCLCGNGDIDCIHKRYYAACGAQMFGEFKMAEGPTPNVALFSRESQGMGDERAVHRFSVGKGGQISSLYGRVIVRHDGTDKGDGQWRCAKDVARGPACIHIKAARRFLSQGNDEDAVESNNIEETLGEGVDVSDSPSLQKDHAVSYLPILPPQWAALDTDPDLYRRAPPLRGGIKLFELHDSRSSCACLDGGRAFYDADLPKVVKTCRVYTLTRAYEAKIELQKCPSCPKTRHRYIGPETREIGLLNYNNSSLYSHELLEEYTSAFTLSETPFDAWSKHIARRYGSDISSLPFVEGKTFRAVWCAYARLLNLEGDMSCRQCGECPETVIWDGVTLAYAKRFVTKNLRPPTTVDDDAPVRHRYPKGGKEWLGTDNTARRRLRLWIQRGGLKVTRSAEDDEQERQKKETAYEHQKMEFPALVEFLSSVDIHLGKMFECHMKKSLPDGKYKSFFGMVCK